MHTIYNELCVFITAANNVAANSVSSASNCLESADLKLVDVSSRSQMENNGWSFDTGYDKFDAFKRKCGVHNTWYGFKYPNDNDGKVSATFTGSGTVTLDYGNCYHVGKVKVYLGNQLKSVANENTPTKQITFDFSPKDVLVVSERASIIKLNSLKLTCKGKTFFHA